MKVTVTRGDRFDVAEWRPGEPAHFGAGGGAPPQGSPTSPTVFAVVASIVVVIGTVLLLRQQQPASLGRPLVPTVADLQAVHAGVTAAGADVRKIRRLAVGDVVETDADGRGRLRLDDGTSFVIDRETRLTLGPRGREGPRLRAGRARGPHRD